MSTEPPALKKKTFTSRSDGMAEWSKALDRFEWSALANSRVLGSNPAQVSDCPTILPGLGGYPGRSV